MAKVKSFFIKIGRWFKDHAPTKRRIIQLYAALLFNANIKGFITGRIYSGPVKNICAPGLNCYSCPGASMACPLGALQDSLASSDTRTPYYIIGILALFGLIAARTICGFLCPTGLAQELLHKIRTPKVKKNRYTRIVSYLKYVILAVMVIAIPIIYQGIPAFCKYICPAGTFEGGIGLLLNSNNTDFFAMLGSLFTWKFFLLVIFVVGSVFFYRFFCRFFCPLGAILGFFNKYALIGVKLDENKCVDCGMCIQTCQMDIRHVGDHECINCGACIPVCPTKAISWKGSQIFLKGTDITVPSSDKGLALAYAGAAGEVEDTTPVRIAPEEVVEKPLPDMIVLSNEKSQASLSAVESEKESETVVVLNSADVAKEGTEGTDINSAKKAKKVYTPAEKVKRRNFWLKFTAWAAALVLLVAALLYYNVFYKGSTVVAYGVGDRCPDFEVQTYDSAGSRYERFNLSEKFSTLENKGTVMVINFWYTTCDPCVEELPHFEDVRKEYDGEIIMVAIHAANGTSSEKVQNFIDSSGGKYDKDCWTDYGIVFAQDTQELDCFTMLGGKGAYPMTVIVNTEGKIVNINQGKVEADDLRSQINSALGRD
ncbi:MAG: 4Fe-4S binding protein [Candidatus Coproplasma sp.]